MNRYSKRGQSIAEYFIIIAIILAAALSIKFLDRISSAIDRYRTKMMTAIVRIE